MPNLGRLRWPLPEEPGVAPREKGVPLIEGGPPSGEGLVNDDLRTRPERKDKHSLNVIDR